jgi:RNA polymerase sigma-70 factor (ECF subfamily)
MYHLARNVLHDHNKQHKKIGFHYNADDLLESLPGSLHANTEIEKKQELQLLALAMMDLGEENRELLILCRFQGLKYAEIATLLGITEATVKVRVHRAIARLKGSHLKIAD